MQVLIYWLARTALMFCVFLALWALGWQPWFAVVGAAAIAWLISYALFGSMHDAAAKQMESWFSRRFAGVEGDEVAEDAESEVRTESKAVTRSASKSKAETEAGPAGAPRRSR